MVLFVVEMFKRWFQRRILNRTVQSRTWLVPGRSLYCYGTRRPLKLPRRPGWMWVRLEMDNFRESEGTDPNRKGANAESEAVVGLLVEGLVEVKTLQTKRESEPWRTV
uniref:(northern house mosquito) hypothetical protein n=1 Tax=Culex pipiens TaxID=7175 RepID=A0A8D8C179_CULPI